MGNILPILFLSFHFHFCFHPNVDSLLTAEATNSATLYELSSVTSEHIICSTRNQIIGYPVSATERVPSTPELRGSNWRIPLLMMMMMGVCIATINDYAQNRRFNYRDCIGLTSTVKPVLAYLTKLQTPVMIK